MTWVFYPLEKPGQSFFSTFPLDQQAGTTSGEFMDLYLLQKCSTSSIIGAKDYTSTQMNMAEADRITGQLNDHFKSYAIYKAICRMGESDDSILSLAKADGIVSNIF
ncbi:40S ribosomal protein S21-like [Psammomys obesus]|uniref:40S ribosomal protein S21-like n=1 Tax=Psammomys obesus TaxID=48139 RepID=UPI00245341A2|nr:40S ribosomal protein S21-like [Psammomys obesus]